MAKRAIVIGAGLSGLSAAVALTQRGVAVELVEGAAHAGGRCRSYHDPQLGQTIDNGNHLVLSGNAAVARFRKTIGASEPLAGPAHADFAFADLASGERWTIGINDGPLPWWIFSEKRRVPGSRAADYLPLAKLLGRGEGKVGDRIKTVGPVWDRLLEPVLLATLNTPVAESSTALTGAVLRETIARGGRAMCPRIAEPTLSAAFIDPALAWLESHKAITRFGRRLSAMIFDGDRLAGLDFGGDVCPVTDDMAVVLAVPAWVAATLVADLVVPDDHRAIVNGHFAIAPPAGAPQMLGLIGGSAEWLFSFPDRLSVTVSAAEHLVGKDREELARIFWADIQAALDLDAPMPRWQIVKEKRATFAATPAQNRRRPTAATRWRNLFLAGDWTATGLPATIEGALRSGETAAGLATGAALR